MSLLIGAASTLGGILADKGVDKLLNANEGKIIFWRAINKTSKKYKGYAPGGKKAVKQYLKIWIESKEFVDFVGVLEQGDSVDKAVIKALSSFKSKSIPSLNKKAETVLAFLFGEINDGLMRSSRGLILGVNRILMKIDQLNLELKKGNEKIIARLDKQSDTLDDLIRTSDSFNENQKSAFEEFLSATQEWPSIKGFLDIGAFYDAQKGIEQRIDKLNEIYQNYPDSSKIFRNHHVELLLKLASLLSNLGRFQKAELVYSDAKKMGIVTPYLKRLESKVLLNLNKVSEFELLVREGELQEKEIAELELYLLKENWNELLSELPETTDNYRLIYLGLLGKIIGLKDQEFKEKALEIENEIERAYQYSGRQPIHKIQVTDISIKYLRRICFGMLPVEELNKVEFVNRIRTYIESAIHSCKKVDYHRGLVFILQHALTFYSMLEEEEAVRETEAKIQRYTDEEEFDYEFDVKRGNISRARELHNKALNLMQSSEVSEKESTEHFLQAAFELSTKEEKVLIGQSLINFYLMQGDIEKAEKTLSRFSEISKHTQLLIELAIFERKEKKEALLLYLKELIKQFPHSIQFRRYHIDLLIQKIHNNSEKGFTIENETLVEEVKYNTEILNELLPTDSNLISYARALIADKDFGSAIKVLREINSDTKVYITALRLIAHCLVESERVHEVPVVFEELAEITNDQRYVDEAAKHYMDEGQIDDASNILSKWVEKFPDNSYLSANLGLSIILKKEATPEEGRKAFNLFSKACGKNSKMPKLYFYLAKAAKIAGKEDVSRRYFSKHHSRIPAISVKDKEDFNQLDRKLTDGIVRMDLGGKEGIKAFVEWNNEFRSALNTFHRNDLMTYIDIFARNGQAWRQWIGWTSAAENIYYESKYTSSIKSPWPFTRKTESVEKDILLDLTALLSLCILSETDKIIRELSSQGIRVFLRSNELRKLRRAVNRPGEILFDVIKYPYDELHRLLKQCGLITDYSKEQRDKFSELVPNLLHESFGNHVLDYGLSLTLKNSCFILDQVDGMENEGSQVLGNLTSSKVLLKSLVNHGLVGENEADRAASQNDRFEGWRNAESINLPNSIVFSAFSIQQWYEVGLLTASNNSWIEGADLWPKINLGPFGVNHLRKEAKLTENEKKVNSLASKQLSELEDLVSEEIVEILSDTEHLEVVDSFLFGSSNVNALKLLALARSKNLNLWTDDRVFGYLLWPFNHPLPLQELRDELSQLQKEYDSIDFFTTEDILEKLEENASTSEFFDEMGYRLVELGYRPLNFRLAVNYLLTNFSYNPELPKYKSFLQTLEGHFVDSNYDTESKVDPKPLQRLFLARIVPGVLAEILLKQTNRSFEERKKFATDILTVMVKYVDRHREEMKDKMASFWISLLHEMVDYQAFNKLDLNNGENKFQKRLDRALDWFTESLIKFEERDNLSRAVLAIEDFIVKSVIQLRELINEKEAIQKLGISDEEINNNVKIFVTKRIRLLIQPLIHDDLIGQFNPLLRRCLGHISLFPHEFKLDEIYWFDHGDKKIKDQISEDELELFALGIFEDILNGNLEYGRFLTSDLRVFCTWNRLKPNEVRTKIDNVYGASINISMLRLILRDELHSMPQVITGIISQLQLIDPILGQQIQDHAERLKDDDPDVRKRTREEVAFFIISSIYFELQRNLPHAFQRLQEIETVDLDRFLGPKTGWFSKGMHPNIVEIDGNEYPRDVLIDSDLLISTPELLYEQCQIVIDSLKKNMTKDDVKDFNLLSFYSTILEEEISSFKFAHRLLEFLLLSSSGPEQYYFKGNEINSKDFLEEILNQVLNPSVENAVSNDIYRASDLRIIHSCLLRLSLFVNGAPKHIQSWNNKLDNNDKVMGHFLNNVLIFSQRLIPFLKGKYGDEVEDLKNELVNMMHSLSISYKEPQSFPDRFNPLLFGPHLFDHEVSSVLYSLRAFISQNKNPELILDLKSLLKLVESWTEVKSEVTEQIYEKQKEDSSNMLDIKMQLSPKKSAELLIKTIEERLDNNES